MPLAFHPHRRSGLTLVEILIALTMTLIVLGTMMTAFRFASEEMQNGRALIELANRARVVEDHLRTDLGSLTVETRVYDGTDEPNGYFEYIEGAIRDSSFVPSNDSFQGDCDDVLCFTARSTDGVLFRGRFKALIANGNGPTDMALDTEVQILESSLAEIVWFTTVNDNEDGPLQPQGFAADGVTPLVDFDDSIRVHRRALLIRPDLNNGNALATNLSLQEVNNYIRQNDISLRVVPNASGTTFDLFPNGLDDLAIRANRFAHLPNLGGNTFPNNFSLALLENRVASDDDENVNYRAAGQTWQALPPILSDVGAFDLRAYSPTARVYDVAAAGVIVEPSDLGYSPAPAGGTLAQRGAYVDLGYFPGAPAARADEWFIANSTRPTNVPNGTNVWLNNTWDTWTPFYERDGIDQDGPGVGTADQGTNGVNDTTPNSSNVIDDPGESETVPPYLQPIRAMKITLRLVEKGTKQVHQVSIIHSFVPE